MRESREQASLELKKTAYRIGGNAVIAVDVKYTQIGDGGFNIVLVVATGTAVVLNHSEN